MSCVILFPRLWLIMMRSMMPFRFEWYGQVSELGIGHFMVVMFFRLVIVMFNHVEVMMIRKIVMVMLFEVVVIMFI